MKINKILSLILASVFVIGALGACTPAQQQVETPPAQGNQATTPPTPPVGGTEPAAPPAAPGGASGYIIIGTENEAATISPGRHGTLAGSFINAMTHNGLFRQHYETLDIIPDLVESFRPISDSLWEFTLHQGVMFHNGEEMTAYDVAASLEYLRTYPYAMAFQGSVIGWEVIDTHTIRLDTGEPNALLFVDLTNHGNFVLPRSLIEAGHDFTVLPIGTGPYMFEEWRTGDFLQFTAFDQYFDTARAPRIRDVTWRIIPEGTSRTIALEMGEIHYIVEVAAPDVPRMQEHPNIHVHLGMSTQHNHLLLNNELPMFSDINVRRALDMAIDKEAVVIVGMDGLATPIWNQVPINFAGVSFENENTFNPEGARALLAEAGVDPATMGFDIIVSNDARRRMAEVIQANLADIGIDVTITQTDFATFFQLTTEGDYETSIANFTSASLLTYMFAMLHRDNIGGLNRNRIDNQELSDLVDLAIATVDESARLSVIGEATALANYYTGMVPLFQALIARAFSSNLAVPETGGAGELHINMMHWLD